MNPPPLSEQANKSLGNDLSTWLPAFEARPRAALRLIAFPYAGGGTPVFRNWPGLLPNSVELRVAQLPGRGPRFREDHFNRVQPAVDAFERNLVPLLDRPFAFFGHSMGAILAFEMTRRLQERGLTPVHLFVSGRMAPQLPDPFPPIHQLPGPLFLEKLKDLNGMTQAVLNSPELLDIVLPVIRSDFTLLETYRYLGSPPSVSCPITIFGGDHDPQTTTEGLNAWREQTAKTFDLRMLPGDHFFIDTARTDLVETILVKLAGTGLVYRDK